MLNLSYWDAETIFRRVETFLENNKLDITRIRFGGMNGCSTMSGEQHGVKTFFKKITSHFTYINCRNRCLALCFAHIIPQYPDFKKLDSLLLNLYLLIKSSTVKQAIFDEVSSKSLRTNVCKTHQSCSNLLVEPWQSCSASLDRYESLIVSLDAIYERSQSQLFVD